MKRWMKCSFCGVDFKQKRNPRASGLHYCSVECANKAKAKTAYETLCKVVGCDFQEWLKREYTDNLRSVRSIAQEVYGKEKNSSSILNWLGRFGIDRRTGGEAIKTQWINNDERREKQAKFIKNKVTDEIRDKITAKMQTPEYKEKQRVSKTGELNGMYGVMGANHPQWNPDRTDEQRVKERKTNEDKYWRKAVFERDNYTCQICGGSGVVAHHIESYMKNESLRHDITNGETLCALCHHEYHTDNGWRCSTRELYESFKESRKRTA